ncbi:DNA-binding transcription factor [Ophidiomyces ophidiicola]|nr:DNA-binding transcription factor [Ophidiomyces ophidiicola]
METAVPVSYGFGGPHDLAAVSHRRLMGPPPDTPMPPYYASPPLPYAAHLHAPAAYGFGHILNTSHASSYQPFYAAAAASPLAHRLPDHPATALARSSAAATPTTTITTTSSSSSSPPSTAAANGLARLIESHPTRLDPDHHHQQHQHHQHHQHQHQHQHPTHHLHHQQHSHSRPASTIHQHKTDDHHHQQHQQPTGDSRPGKQSLRVKPDIEFSTEVDTLMKTIQSKPKLAQPQLPPLHQFTTGVPGWPYPGPGAAVSAAPPPPPPPPLVQQQQQQQQQQQSSSSLSSASMFAPPQPDRPPPSKQKSRRKYECTLPNCRKSFYQKTHLDIHMRAHTGDKPFICKEAGCGQRFSQLGNLKTHERRHTGEKPYSCDICNKKFAQRGNVRAHKITHEKAKPFICRLDDCGKQFTQLGNLKSHQNKFHAQTLRELTIRFSTLSETERLAQHDVELWEYFATLYKNSNKGIKGRGKDRRVSSTAKQLRHPPPPPPPPPAPSSSSHPHPHPLQHPHPHPPAPSSSASSSASLSSSSSTAGSSVSSGMDEMGGTATSAAAAGSLDDEKHRMSLFHHRSSYLSTPSSDEVEFHEQMYSRGPH